MHQPTYRELAERYDWPDPPMVPTVALRRIEKATTLDEVRMIVHQFIRPKVTSGE
jgi:hypothetical protein